MRFTSAFLVAAVISIGPAFAQGYHYSWGDSRVVNQGQIGLSNPSGTYIGSGTLSKSAQGYMQSGAQVNPGLPRVNMGAHIATPGDNQYGANRTTVGAPMVGNSPVSTGLPGAAMGSHVGTPGDAMRSDLHPEVNNTNMKFRWGPPAGTSAQQQEEKPINIYKNTAAKYDFSGASKLSY